jgi:hypothetical protein
MADKKITQLTNITGANLVDADEFVVVDISADETKAITLGELKEAFDSGSGFVRITGDTMTGDLALSGADVTFGDNDKAIFGAGSDLQIYHDGSDSYIKEDGTGNLIIAADDFRVTNVAVSETMFAADTDGTVSLYYNGAAKLATTATGIDVTGNATFADNGKAIFGAGSDLQIYHDGSNSRIVDGGVGSLIIQSNQLVFKSADDSEILGYSDENGAFRLYYDGSEKIATTSTGIDVTGTVTADGLTVDASNSTFNGAIGITSAAGAGITEGLLIDYSTNLARFLTYDSSTGSELAMYTQPSGGSTKQRFRINSDGDISFYEDTGATAKFFWDASAESLTLNSTLKVEGGTTNGFVQASGSLFQLGASSFRPCCLQ